MPKSVSVDTALVSVLAADAALLALCPGGVYFGTAPQSRRNFVLVTLVASFDQAQFAAAPQLRRAIEDTTYLVRAVMLDSATGNADDAAQRIDELLEDQPLQIPGYGWLSTVRTERIRYPETDTVDQTIRWQHHGGHYRVQVTPIGEAQ